MNETANYKNVVNYYSQENERLRKALEEIANSDGWLIEPGPIATVPEAYAACVETAIKALKGDSK